MNSSGNHVGNSATIMAASPEDAERRALVQRITASRHFARAHQLRDILLYLVDRALLDPSDPIHEHEIACTVLSRKADFNPHEDNIVRVQVSHLRKRLDEYFSTEGLEENLRISVPKGGYTLRFDSRPAEPVAATAIVPEPAPELRPRTPFSRSVAFSLSILITAGAAAAYLSLRYWPARNPSHRTAAVARTGDADLLWPRLFNVQSSNIVVADTCLEMLQDILHTDIELSDYLNGQYPASLLDKVRDQSLQGALSLISKRQYTSLADLNSAERLSELSHRYSTSTPAIRYARHMNVRDFKTGNFILVGSRRGIPWVRLFESQLNFSMEEDQPTRTYYYRNKSPRQGEPMAWYQETKADASTDSYADVALVPNLDNTGYVLILSGICMEASEAAGEFVTRAEFQKTLGVIFPKISSRPQLRYFELLLRTRAVAGAARSSQVVASRVFSAPIPGSL